MKNAFRKWLCKRFNLIGAETVYKVTFREHVYEWISLDMRKSIDELSTLSTGSTDKVQVLKREFPPIVTFDWMPR